VDTTDDQIVNDAPLFEDAAPIVPPADSKPDPLADPLADPLVQLAIERAKTEAYEKALANRVDPTPTTQRAPEFNAQRTMQPPPATWQDMMNAEQRKQYEEALLINPQGAAQFAATMAAQHNSWVLQYQAAPILQSNALLIVESFKNRMRGRDHKLYDQIEPLFDAEMARTPDLRALTTMASDARDSELRLRWDSAKSQVQDRIMANPPKVEPTLLASGSTPAPTRATPSDAIKSNPTLAMMHEKYKFTPEQLKELQEI
jgi:hypothetical protein